MTIKKNLFALSLRDFFTPYFLTLAIMPLIITLALLFGSLLYGMQLLHDRLNSVHIEKTSTQYDSAEGSHSENSLSVSFDDNTSTTSFLDINPTQLLNSLQDSKVLDSLLEYAWIQWLVEKVLLLFASYLILIIGVIIAVVIVGFFTPLVVRKLKSRHYPPFAIKGHGSLLYVLWYAIKSFVIMILLYVLLIPVYFIPFVNILAFHLPAYYFFHKMLVFDVGSTINTQKEYQQIKATVGNQIRLRTLLVYLLTLIPFVGIIFPLLFVIYLSHIFINESIELRLLTDN